jgi:glycosyltransferase 2 family protein
VRRWLVPLLTLAFIWILISRFDEVKMLVMTLATGNWRWIVVALLVQTLYFLVYALSYRASFATVGIPMQMRSLIPLTFASIFVNTTAPTGGAAGGALLVEDAARHGYSRPRAATGFLLQMATDYGSFTILLLVGLGVLIKRGELHWYELISAILLFLYVGGIAGALLLGLWHPRWLHRILAWLQQKVNYVGAWIRKPALLAEDWSERNAEEFIDASRAIAARPRHLILTLLATSIFHCLAIATLYALFFAFGEAVKPGVVIAGYATITLFSLISPTPNGVGIVEGLMPHASHFCLVGGNTRSGGGGHADLPRNYLLVANVNWLCPHATAAPLHAHREADGAEWASQPGCAGNDDHGDHQCLVGGATQPAQPRCLADFDLTARGADRGAADGGIGWFCPAAAGARAVAA